jgi:eukaryotic-like serine/threonine-protein kinase
LPDRFLGRQIGKYRVIRLLGAGAFAWVYEAIDRDLEIPVALKILRPEFAGQQAAEQRFRREAATAARLRHPNIVTVRDVGQSDGASFVAMDLLPLSLARRLELVTRLPEPEVVRLGLDIAAALAIAHAGGVIHRDIKPDNILIGPNGEAVVADFGLARALSADVSLSATNQVMGTPHYFSPEQARGQELDGRSDLYSLGVTLYRAITARLPFEGDDWYAVARHHVETPPPAPRSLVPDITPAFEAILMKLLAKAPENRFETATQLADALATLPTAPVQRGGVLTPHSSSQTVLDLTPVQSHAALQRAVWTRRARYAGVAGMVAVALWAAEQQSGFVSDVIGRPAGAGDTLNGALPNSPVINSVESAGRVVGVNPLGGDSALRQRVSDSLALGGIGIGGTGTPKPVAGPTRTSLPQAPQRATLSVFAPESAAIYVDGERVGNGSWAGQPATGTMLKLRAVITDASQINCPSAQRDTVVRLTRGEQMTVRIPVRGCVALDLGSVTPRDANVSLEPLDGGAPVSTTADAKRAPMVMTGRYLVSITSPRCITFTSTDTIRRTSDGTPHRIVAKLPC